MDFAWVHFEEEKRQEIIPSLKDDIAIVVSRKEGTRATKRQDYTRRIERTTRKTTHSSFHMQ
jgi:hypothetical protein